MNEWKFRWVRSGKGEGLADRWKWPGEWAAAEEKHRPAAQFSPSIWPSRFRDDVLVATLVVSLSSDVTCPWLGGLFLCAAALPTHDVTVVLSPFSSPLQRKCPEIAKG